MKMVLCIFFALHFMLITTNAQSQQKNVAKNFPEGFAGIEWNAGSALVGFNYERYLLEKNQCVIGVKFTHSCEYTEANLVLFYGGEDIKNSFNSIKATLHKFFKPGQEGFFLSAELGGGLRKARYQIVEQSTWFAARGAGLGWQFEFIGKAVMRWSFTLTFEGRGGITAMGLAVGF